MCVGPQCVHTSVHMCSTTILNHYNSINSQPSEHVVSTKGTGCASCSQSGSQFTCQINSVTLSAVLPRYAQYPQCTAVCATEADTELRGNFIRFCAHFQLLANQCLLGSGINTSKQRGVIKAKTKGRGKYVTRLFIFSVCVCVFLHMIQMESATAELMSMSLKKRLLILFFIKSEHF